MGQISPRVQRNEHARFHLTKQTHCGCTLLTPLIGAEARKQQLAGLPAGQPQALVDRLPRLVGEFEPHRSARLSLANRRTIERIAVRCHVIDADGDNVTAAQLAVDRQVEQRKIPRARLYLELGPN